MCREEGIYIFCLFNKFCLYVFEILFLKSSGSIYLHTHIDDKASNINKTVSTTIDSGWKSWFSLGTSRYPYHWSYMKTKPVLLPKILLFYQSPKCLR